MLVSHTRLYIVKEIASFQVCAIPISQLMGMVHTRTRAQVLYRPAGGKAARLKES